MNLIINFTPTGMIPTKEMTHHVPISVSEILEDVHAACEIGITMVHLHARDESTGDPSAWHWQFEGGSPPVSFEQNPGPVYYYEAGAYDVTLIVSNDFGVDTEIKES